ncbi:MAG: 4-(cytidine 5'-diphospho)-2-C-methyl-D-erythritol kinase [Planctomycetes bacterium]|nr:4-(cytidine 5'-diphospho)-2-C-methyl-D-erythritol kinase [Planctomycetota bacterium]
MIRRIGGISLAGGAKGIHTGAPAKINLTLRVLGKRPDGFHEIKSLAMGVGLFDTLRIAPSMNREIRVTCNLPDLKQADNLVFRAAALFQRSSQIEVGAVIDVCKQIPLGAGLGGGSSDAAASLRLCDALWQTDRCPGALCEIGASIGSDVPLFFHLPVASVSGRGECVAPVSMSWSGWAVLILPPLAISTPDAYRAWDEGTRALGIEASDSDIACAKSAVEISAMIVNDLQSAAFRLCPQLRELFETLMRRSGVSVHMTGSGAALFQLFDDCMEAQSIAQSVERELRLNACVVHAPEGMSPLLAEEQ